MKAGLRDLCSALSTVLSLLAAMSSFAAISTNDKGMYIQAIVLGIAGVGMALGALLRM